MTFTLTHPGSGARAFVEIGAGKAGAITVGLEVLERGDGTEREVIALVDTNRRVRIEIPVDDAAELARLIEKALASGQRRRARRNG